MAINNTLGTKQGLVQPGKSQFNNASTLNPGGNTLGSMYKSAVTGGLKAVGSAIFPGNSRLISSVVNNSNSNKSPTQSFVPPGYTPPAQAATGTPQVGSGIQPVGSGTPPNTLSPVSTDTDVGANTYNGGVNANGQRLAGYTPTGLVPLPNSFSGISNSLADTSRQSSPEYQAAQKQYNEANQQLAELKKSAANNQLIGAGTNMAEYAGTQGLIANRLANEQNALVGEMAAAQAAAQAATGQQSTQQVGLGAAAGLTKPITGVPYGTQTIDPATGQPIGGGGGNLQSAVQDISERVKNGTMGYNDAIGALGAYGQAGVDALLQELGPNFNVSQSNTLAGQQGSIGPNYQLAEQAITNLENTVKELGQFQNTNIPFINSIGNFVSGQTGIGSDKTRQYTQAVQSARATYAALLSSVKGGTPTDYSNQALAEIPDNPTPNDIAALRHSFEVLGQARRDIFGNPGAAGQNQSNDGGLYNF